MPKDLAIAMLEIDEGLRLKPYRCTSSKLTIGYGRNLDDRGITIAEADQMLLNDVECFYTQLSKFPAFAKLNEARQAVLVNMAFNLGMAGIRDFKMMWAAISLDNYQGAAVQMLQSKWAGQVGQRATRLAEIMRAGSIQGK
jgi:lysozyme